MKVAVVGAGSVGQAFGYHLQKGGAELTFLVRPKYVAELEQGRTVFPLNRRRTQRHDPLRFDGYAVVGSVQSLPSDTDQIWLCMPLTGYDDEQIQALAERAPKALIITMMSNLHLAGRLRRLLPEHRLVLGMITLAGFPTPLDGSPIKDVGQAWWFPPGAPTFFEGQNAASAARALRQGGAPAKAGKGVVKRTSLGSSVLIPCIAALELDKWSFAHLRKSETRHLLGATIREVQAILKGPVGGAGPLAIARHPWALCLALTFAHRLPPFDLQAFFACHFQKVGAQTEVMLEDWIRQGRAAHKATQSIEGLLAALREKRLESPKLAQFPEIKAEQES